MPNGFVEYALARRVPKQEEGSFQDWLRAKGGWKAPSARYVKINDPRYQEWVQLGKPTGVTWRATEEEKRFAGLKPKQKATEIGAGPYPIDKYPQPPFPLGEGWEWGIETHDPATGMPIEAAWVRKRVSTKKNLEEDLIWYVLGEVLWNRKTGKFYDAGGQMEISAADALAIKRRYDEAADAKALKPSAEAMALERSRVQQESLRLQHLLSPQRGIDIEELRRAASEEGFERARQAIMAQATGPRDWIIRGIAELAVNPYTAPEVSERQHITEEIERTGAEAKRWGEIASTGSETEEQGGIFIGPGGVKALATQAQETSLKNLAEWQTRLEQAQDVWRPPAASRPTIPPTPAWLPEYVPGLQAGQPITKRFVPTPSGQQLTRMPWSQTAMLAGYAEFAGGRPFRDILEHAEMMQPRTPRGAGAARWRPPAQLA